MLSIVLILFFDVASYSQNNPVKKDTAAFHLNPLLLSSFKKPVKTNPLLAAYIKPAKHELMYWPNYPLNAVQIEARDREWDRKYNQPLGKQIAHDIITNIANEIIFGKKVPPAAVPKF